MFAMQDTCIALVAWHTTGVARVGPGGRALLTHWERRKRPGLCTVLPIEHFEVGSKAGQRRAQAQNPWPQELRAGVGPFQNTIDHITLFRDSALCYRGALDSPGTDILVNLHP